MPLYFPVFLGQRKLLTDGPFDGAMGISMRG